jgi:FMN phosphatase YigB (HAD superfamily)
MKTIKLVMFDAYGTLFDMRSIEKLLEGIYPNQGAQLATIS